ncbi:hypothetical protein PR048_011161 [Dryococelus australis]|uniref:DUF4371 domain-containing protein n=1 Tax=Dryococelus australis TaxID=614101 RepID=A0ABQ9HLB2_9NEOP|nr:hypothetical protein PR048_011161 [Dryococelus australis]
MCTYCSLFGPGYVGGYQKNVRLGNLVTKPLTKFSDVIGKAGVLVVHKSTEYHKNADEAVKNFLKVLGNAKRDVLNVQNSKRLEQITENHKRLVPIVKTVIKLGQHNFPFQGAHDDGQLLLEDSKSQTNKPEKVVNEGNFWEFLRFRIDAGDETLKEHLENTSSRATYISKTVQHELIECCGEEIVNTIVRKIRDAGEYSTIFDETTDVSHRSQLSLSIEYVSKEGVAEDFIEFLNLHKELDNMRLEDAEEVDDEPFFEPKMSGIDQGKIVVTAMTNKGFDPLLCVGIATSG